MTEPAGLVLFDKPAGWTSHDAAEALRRMLPRGTKVGHTGTLDPLATGLLILLVGPCTRLQGTFQGLDKTYSGTIRLGIATDTGDIMGKTLAEKPVPALDLKGLQEALSAHLGTLEMPAPAYSAVKHKGRPLYHYARRGEAVPEKTRRCEVREWTALAYAPPELSHRLSCSSGTYVRSLAESVGRRLGCGAAVSTLRRESIADFPVEDALSLEALKGLSTAALRDLLVRSIPRLQAFSAR